MKINVCHGFVAEYNNSSNFGSSVIHLEITLKYTCDALFFYFFILFIFYYYFIVFNCINIFSICNYKMCKYEKYVNKLLLNFVILKVQLFKKKIYIKK